MKETDKETKRDFIATVLVLDSHLCSVMGEVWVWLEHWDFIDRENKKGKKMEMERKMTS